LEGYFCIKIFRRNPAQFLQNQVNPLIVLGLPMVHTQSEHREVFLCLLYSAAAKRRHLGSGSTFKNIIEHTSYKETTGLFSRAFSLYTD
jgi:hypothetical protein